MNITLIADIYGENNNGTTITARRLVENMKKRGHNVTVVSPYDGGEGHIVLNKRKFIAFNNYINKTNGVAFGEFDENKIREGLKNCDVVHFLLPFKDAKKSIKICRELKVPYTTAFHAQPQNITSHVFLKNCKWVNDLIYGYYNRKFYKNVEFIHCPSQFIANELIRNKYPAAEKRVISNGVIPTFKPLKTQKPEELKDKIVIVNVGRLVKEKRQDLLINAIKKSKYADKIQLIMAGNGPLYKHYVKLGKDLPNPPIIKLFKKEELCAILNYADLYVHPSDVEIEAISCIEAFTCGLVPVISDSKNSATGQFALSDKHLFKRGDSDSLKERMEYWLEHEAEKKSMSEKYIEYSKQFSIDLCMDKMEQMFYDCIDYYKEFYAGKKDTLS